MDLVKCFKETLEWSDSIYKKETDLLKKSTYIVHDAAAYEVPDKDKRQKISFVHCSSLQAAASASGKVAVLNFADAYDPGGLVWYGATTQEESLCRSSNLYRSIEMERCMQEYYDYNKVVGNDLEFTDTIIYSPGVTVFRDDNTLDMLKKPYKIDIITCPAPAKRVKDIIVENRIFCILQAAAHENVDTLILGTWGCGAFGNDPVIMGRCFGRVLREHTYFDEVIFAIKGTPGVKEVGSKLQSFGKGFFS